MKVTSRQDFSSEQRDRFEKIDSKESLLEFIKDEGIELNDEQLEAVSGGNKTWDDMRSCVSS